MLKKAKIWPVPRNSLEFIVTPFATARYSLVNKVTFIIVIQLRFGYKFCIKAGPLLKVTKGRLLEVV